MIFCLKYMCFDIFYMVNFRRFIIVGIIMCKNMVVVVLVLEVDKERKKC